VKDDLMSRSDQIQYFFEGSWIITRVFHLPFLVEFWRFCKLPPVKQGGDRHSHGVPDHRDVFVVFF